MTYQFFRIFLSSLIAIMSLFSPGLVSAERDIGLEETGVLRG